MSSSPEEPDHPPLPPQSPPILARPVLLESEMRLPVPRYLDEADLHTYRRRVRLPLILFLTTCFTTYATGAYDWKELEVGVLPFNHAMWDKLHTGWRTGLAYMIAVMSVLLAHEMGHFLMTVRYRIRSTYPMFIPLPITFIGTMGAVISMEGSRADRKQLFDIGIAGPLAGLVLAVPLICVGIRMAPSAEVLKVQSPATHFGAPLLVRLLVPVIRPDIEADQLGDSQQVNPIYMAGWVGLLVTGLNMLPISQLDGGHVVYALFGRRSYWIARGVLLTAIVSIAFNPALWTWAPMLILVILLGIHHPRTANDQAYLSWGRRLLGIGSLVIPILCFMPYPITQL